MSDFRKHLEKQMQNPSFASKYGKPSKTRNQRKLSIHSRILIAVIVFWFVFVTLVAMWSIQVV